MKRKLTYSILTALGCASLAQGAWTPIVDLDSYQAGWGEAELQAEGWTFQDGDYFNLAGCTDGTSDCTAWRAVVSSPFSPTYGSANSFELRSGDPSSSFIANSRANTAIELPVEIPLDGKATIYVQFSIDSVEGNRFITLSDRVFPNAGPVATVEEIFHYDQNGPLLNFRSDYYFNIWSLSNGYFAAYVDNDDSDAHKLEPGIWYEVWLHVNNASFATNPGVGSTYDVYMRGGKFGNADPVHLTNTTPAAETGGYTDWDFRRNVDEPVRTLNFISQYGNPNDTTHGTGAFWMNVASIYPGEWRLDRPGGGTTTEDWHGYTVTASGWADTGDWMGWLHVSNDPWLYSDDLAGWIYEGSVEADGGWMYVIK